VSNDHDGVSEDGQPVVAASSDEANGDRTSEAPASAESAAVASASVVGAGAGASGADESKVVAADGHDKPRTAPPAEDSEASVAADAAALSTPGPVSAGSARAAARRSAARAGVSEAKGTATPKRAASTTVKKPNIFARFGRFMREVVAELRKVIWPTRNQMVTYTIVVIVFVSFMVALVGVLDLLFAKGVLAVFG